MIYGICGASGSGKTTLAKAVADLMCIKFVPTSVTEMAKKAGFEAVGRMSLPERFTLQLHLFDQFEELLNGITGPAILDRTPLDMIGYLHGEIGMHSRNLLMPEEIEMAAEYVADCQRMTARYFDGVFFTSILPTYEEADTRPGFNPAYQQHVQLVIAGALATSSENIQATMLMTTDLQQRLDIVTHEIAERLDEIDVQKRTSRHIH